MPWKKVAEGTSLSDLRQIVPNMELSKGTRMRVTMETGWGWVFDLAGMELVFNRYVPEGMSLIDVWGEGRKGIVEMEADPVWLAAALGFIKTHWLAVTIATILGTFVLTAIITSITVSIKTPEAVVPIVLLAAAGAVGLVLLSTLPGRRK